MVGALIARQYNQRSGHKAQLEKLQAESDEYRAKVRSHFIDTVSLMSQIDQRQRQLHRSVAQGVVDLCTPDGTDSDHLLEQSVHALIQDNTVVEEKTGD